jgi:phospho-N-acetylmuramoyl-pentapeptide-transferase
MNLEYVFAFILSAIVSVIVGLIIIPILRRLKAEQIIRQDGPVWHNKKQGTPTMGGFIFIISITLTCLTVGIPKILEGYYTHLFILVFALLFGAIGFYDDYMKFK